MSRPSQRTFEQRLADGVIVGAEGYVFELERRGYIKAGPYVPEVILDAPDALRQLHREFLRAGSDVMVALTYYAHREKLKDVGRDGDLEQMNRQAVRIANEIAAEGGALVAGNICNTWSYDPRGPARVRRRRPRAVRGAARLGRRGGRRLRHRRDLRPPRRGADRARRLQAARAAGHGDVRERAARRTTYDGYDYVDACRILADERRDGRRPQLLPGARDDAAAARADPLGGRRRRWRRSRCRTGPRRPRPPSSRCESADGRAAVPDRSSSPSSARGSRWRTSRAGRATSASTTSASAAAGDRTTSAPWPRRSGARPPASRYSPAIELHPVLGARARRTTSSWAAGEGTTTAREPPAIVR